MKFINLSGIQYFSRASVYGYSNVVDPKVEKRIIWELDIQSELLWHVKIMCRYFFRTDEDNEKS